MDGPHPRGSRRGLLILNLDTSVLVSLLSSDASSDRDAELLRRPGFDIVVSDFAVAEFASAMSQAVRKRDFAIMAAQNTLANLDQWVANRAMRALTRTEDIQAAENFLRRLDLPLRAPDAIHIAIAMRLGAALATFDERMATSARILGAVVMA